MATARYLERCEDQRAARIAAPSLAARFSTNLGNGRQILIAGANWCSGGCGMHDAGRAELDKP